jgi:hypothetical protein
MAKSHKYYKEQLIKGEQKVREEFEQIQMHLRVLIQQQQKIINLEELIQDKQLKINKFLSQKPKFTAKSFKNKKLLSQEKVQERVQEINQHKEECLELQEKLNVWINTECTLLDKWYGKVLVELHGRLLIILEDCLKQLDESK